MTLPFVCEALHTADLDDDGLADVVVPLAGSVQLLGGTADGVLSDLGSVVLPAQQSARRAATADLDGDGVLDLVWAYIIYDAGVGGPDGGFGRALGTGGGAFAPPDELQVLLSFGFDDPELSLGDMNDDGVPDLVAAVTDSTTVVMALGGDGLGDFGNASSQQLSGVVVGAELADLDLDGDLDVALLTSGPDALFMLAGAGDGSLGVPQQVGTPVSPADLQVAYVHGDGLLDLLVSEGTQQRVGTWAGLGGGAFGNPDYLDVGDTVGELAVALVDDDPWPDLCMLRGGFPSEVLLARGTSSGLFSPADTTRLGRSAFALALGDVSGDGRPDLLASFGYSSDAPSVAVHLQRPSARRSAPA